MAKQSIKQRETQVPTDSGVGKQFEQTFTIEDVSLPSPQELEAYKKINPNIVDFLLSASKKEQEHRHDMDVEKYHILENTNFLWRHLLSDCYIYLCYPKRDW